MSDEAPGFCAACRAHEVMRDGPSDGVALGLLAAVIVYGLGSVCRDLCETHLELMAALIGEIQELNVAAAAQAMEQAE